jgi:hypothetical protein
VKLPFRGKGAGRRNTSRQNDALLPSLAVEPVQDLRPRNTTPNDQVWPADDVAVLGFLERSLEGLEPPSVPVPKADLAGRTLELANADWPHQDAAEELARLADYDCQLLNAAGKTLVLYALTCPVSDAQAIRVGKVLRLAVRRSAVHATGKIRGQKDHDGR